MTLGTVLSVMFFLVVFGPRCGLHCSFQVRFAAVLVLTVVLVPIIADD